jgi:hypothetical protein
MRTFDCARGEMSKDIKAKMLGNSVKGPEMGNGEALLRDNIRLNDENNIYVGMLLRTLHILEDLNGDEEKQAWRDLRKELRHMIGEK